MENAFFDRFVSCISTWRVSQNYIVPLQNMCCTKTNSKYPDKMDSNWQEGKKTVNVHPSRKIKSFRKTSQENVGKFKRTREEMHVHVYEKDFWCASFFQLSVFAPSKFDHMYIANF